MLNKGVARVVHVRLVHSSGPQTILSTLLQQEPGDQLGLLCPPSLMLSFLMSVFLDIYDVWYELGGGSGSYFMFKPHRLIHKVWTYFSSCAKGSLNPEDWFEPLLWARTSSV